MYKKKLAKYLNKNFDLQKGGGKITEEICREFIEKRKVIYENMYNENGELIDIDSIKNNKCIEDFEIFGQIVKKYGLNFDLYIGATNSIDYKSDYERFNGIKNSIVIQNSSNINILNCSPIAFFVDIKDVRIVQLLIKYFENCFENIYFDRSTSKFFDENELALPYNKILTIGGNAYFDIMHKGGLITKGISDDYFEIMYFDVISGFYNPASEYIKYLLEIAKNICHHLNFSTDICSNKEMLYEISKELNRILFGKGSSKINLYGIELNISELSPSLLRSVYYQKLLNLEYFSNIQLYIRKNKIYDTLLRSIQRSKIKINICEKCNWYQLPKFDNYDSEKISYFRITRIN